MFKIEAPFTDDISALAIVEMLEKFTEYINSLS